MTQALGSKSYLAYVAEVTPGTTPSTPTLTSVPMQSESLDLSRGLITDSSLRTDGMQRFARLGNKSVGGSVSVSYAPQTYDAFLESAFRSTWATNTLKFGTAEKFFSLEVGNADTSTYKQFTGCRVSTFTLNVPTGNSLVTGDFEFLGMDGNITSTSLDADGVTPVAEGTPFVHLDGTFSEGGSTIGYLTGIQVKIDNQLKQNYAAGSAAARSITHGMANVTFQITGFWESSALFTKWLNETSSSLTFTLNSGSNSQTWTIPKVHYDSFKMPIQNDGAIIQTLTGRALYDATSGTILTVTRV